MEISLDTIASAVQGEIKGDSQKMISGAAPFEEATENEITFAVGSKYLNRINDTNAGAVIVPMQNQNADTNLVVVKNPEVAFAKALKVLYPPEKQTPGIHPSAVIEEDFLCKGDVSIGPLVVVADNVTLGKNVTLHPGVVLEKGVTIGDDVEIHPNVTVLRDCIIGNRVVIQAGSVIGSDGFGYKPMGEEYIQTPHIGIVRIDDDVEIGAGNTIDRGTLGDTWLKKGVKTDNLVHVAHNVTVGENVLLIGQAGIAGSATIGNNAIIAGQSGVGDHITVGDHSVVAPRTSVAQSVPSGQIVSGAIPEMPHKVWLRVQRIIRQLPELRKKVLDLEKKVNQK